MKVTHTHYWLKVSNYLLKLPATNTCRNGAQAVCFKGSLLWNKIPEKCKNINTLEEFKTQIKLLNFIICSRRICREIKLY